MNRPITGYHLDTAGDWVAELDCGHGQHVRHDPPFVLRPWTQTQAGRDAMIGTELVCVRCDRLELPEGFECYTRTSDFDERSIPPGLRSEHTTRAGVWASIVVQAGSLRYVIEPPIARDLLLDPGHPGTVAPGVAHRVEPVGAVRFHVEFHRRRAGGEGG